MLELRERDALVLLACSEGRNGSSERLQSTLRDELPATQFEVVDVLCSLGSRLRKPKGGLDIAILEAPTHDHLRELVSMRELLEGLRIVLVMGDSDAESVSLGHKLRPRYLSSGEGDFQDVAKVLRKMLGASSTIGEAALSEVHSGVQEESSEKPQ